MVRNSKFLALVSALSFSLAPAHAALALPGIMTAASGPTLHLTQDTVSKQSYVKVLSDHPGSATALTSRQKSEIRAILELTKGNQIFICTAASLDGQRKSMYPVVLLRAQLVCDYAKSLRPDLKTTVQEKRTTASKFNGRVVVVSTKPDS